MRKIHGTRKPETILQNNIVKMLKINDWGVRSTHGNLYQCGFPDLYAFHLKNGTRWIEVKIPTRRGCIFTAGQLEFFPELASKGVGVWVLTDATDYEYKKLFKPPNWHQYLEVMR